jgi:hypothetical protein
MCTPTSHPRAVTSRFLVCEKWPSRFRTTGSSAFGLTILIKFSNHWVKMCVCIHPDGWHAATVPGGVPLSSSGYSLVLGNTINCGIKIPPEVMHATTVIEEPLSAEDNLGTCFFPFTLRTFVLVPRTMKILVSKTLYTFVGSNFTFCNSNLSRSKKASTFSFVKLYTLAKQNNWGVLKADCGCLLMKFLDHFFGHSLTSWERMLYIIFNSKLIR